MNLSALYSRSNISLIFKSGLLFLIVMSLSCLQSTYTRSLFIFFFNINRSQYPTKGINRRIYLKGIFSSINSLSACSSFSKIFYISSLLGCFPFYKSILQSYKLYFNYIKYLSFRNTYIYRQYYIGTLKRSSTFSNIVYIQYIIKTFQGFFLIIVFIYFLNIS